MHASMLERSTATFVSVFLFFHGIQIRDGDPDSSIAVVTSGIVCGDVKIIRLKPVSHQLCNDKDGSLP